MASRHRTTNRIKAKTVRNKARARAHQRHRQARTWLAAGVVTLGASAALASGSGLAHADTTHASGSTSLAGGSSQGSGSASGSMRAATSTRSSAAASGNTGSRLVPNTASTKATRSTRDSRTFIAKTNSGTTTPAIGAATPGTALTTSTGSKHPATGEPTSTPTPGTAAADSTGLTRSTPTHAAPSLQGVTPNSVKLQARAPSTATQNTTLAPTRILSKLPTMVTTPSIATPVPALIDAATPTTPPATTGVVAKLLSQFLTLVGATSLLNNTGPGSQPPPSTPAGALAGIERDPQSALHSKTPTAEPGLINRLIGMLSLGALHPNDASSVQAVDQVTVAPVTAAPINQPAAAGDGTVALQMKNVTEPVINISVNGGPTVPVLVDTGSAGLVVGLQDIGLKSLGFPTGFGISGYSGGLHYLFVKFKTTVNFGNGIVTAPTPVDVVLLTFPISLSAFLAPDGADGVLGIGPNSLGPGPGSVTASLPGDLSDGVLIDESQGVLQFGPNPLTTRVSVSGAPYANLEVQVGNGPLEPVKVAIDSGGVYGTIPSSVIGNSQRSGHLPAGTLVSVYTGDGQTLLYSYTTTATNTPTITSGDVMNTGYVPFAQQPVYVENRPSGIGTTSLDYV
jgi:hypothetical protein